MDKRDGRPLVDLLRPEELPRLALFLAGHVGAESAGPRGSAAAAAHAFAAEAELDELEELAQEWELLRAAAREMPPAELNRLLARRFGAGWPALSAAEIEAVAFELERAQRE